jgi:hypothetical protein
MDTNANLSENRNYYNSVEVSAKQPFYPPVNNFLWLRTNTPNCNPYWLPTNPPNESPYWFKTNNPNKNPYWLPTNRPNETPLWYRTNTPCNILNLQPAKFAEINLNPESIIHLRQATNNAWKNSPVESALEYLYWQSDPDERPKVTGLQVFTEVVFSNTCCVTVVNNNCLDDSVEMECNELTLQNQNGFWIPLRHRVAWKGRGLEGWSAKPAK